MFSRYWVLACLLILAMTPTPTFVSMERGVPVPPWYRDAVFVVTELGSWPSADTSLIGEVANSVARWSWEMELDPSLTLAVMRVENPWLKPDTVSYAGAVGLMQVMPRFWAESFPECGAMLVDIDTNVCKGTKILRYYIDRADGDLRMGLLAYNGCHSKLCEKYSNNVQGYID